MSNLDRLVKAGIVNMEAGTGHTQADIDRINALSPAEVDHLIAVKEKMGADFMTQHSAPNQSFFVF